MKGSMSINWNIHAEFVSKERNEEEIDGLCYLFTVIVVVCLIQDAVWIELMKFWG